MQVPHLHVEVKGALAALLVTQVSHTLHFGGVKQVLEVVGLVHEQRVNAQLLEVDIVHVLFAVAQLFQLGFKGLLAALHVTHRGVFLSAGALALQDRHFQSVDLLLVKCLLVCLAHGYHAELLVAHDNRVVVAGGDTVCEHLTVGGGEVLGFQHQDFGCREVGKELIAPLGYQVFGDGEQGLFHDTQLAQLHGSGGHFIGLARAYPVGQQGVTAAVDDALHRVFLVGAHFHVRVAADHGQAGAVILGRYGVVENIVVEAAQVCPAGFVAPDPALELCQHLFQLLLGRCRGLLIQHAGIAHAAPHADGLIVQGCFQDAVSAAHKGIIGGAPGGRVLRAVTQPCVINVDEELTDGAVVLHFKRRYPLAVSPGIPCAAQHFTGKGGVHAVGYPGSAQTHLDLLGGNVGGDHLAQSFHVALIVRVALGQGLRVAQLGAHVASQIQLGSFQIAVAVLESQAALQHFPAHFLGLLAGQLGNAAHVHGAGFVHGDSQGLLHGVRVGDGLNCLNGVLGEDGRFFGLAGVPVIIFQGQDEGSVRVLHNQPLILGGVQVPVLLHESVIQGIELLPGLGDCGRAAVVHLEIQQGAGGITDAQNVGHALHVGLLDAAGLHQLPAVVLVELAALVDQAALLCLASVSLDLGPDLLLGGLGSVVHLDLNTAKGLFDLLLEAYLAVQGVVGDDGSAILSRAIVCHAQHHFGVLDEIFVDCIRSPSVRASPGLVPNVKEALALVGGTGFPLLEHQNVRNHVGAGSLKGGVGEADSADQVSLLHEVAAGSVAGRVQGAAAGDNSHNAAGAGLVQALGDKVVVDRFGDCCRVCLVGHAEVTERHVANYHVHVVVGDFGSFKALHAHVGVGIEVLCDIAGDLVQLNSRPGFHTAQHIRRHSAQEAAHARRGFQQSAAGEAQLCKAVIHTLDNGRLGVVCVQDGALGGLVLALVQQLFQLLKLLGPVRFLLVEYVGQAAPAGVLRKDFLLLGSSQAALGHNGPHGLDRVGVGLIPCLWGGGELLTLGTNHKIAALGLLLVAQVCLFGNLFLGGGRFRGFLAYLISRSLQVAFPLLISFGMPAGYALHVTVRGVCFLHPTHCAAAFFGMKSHSVLFAIALYLLHVDIRVAVFVHRYFGDDKVCIAREKRLALKVVAEAVQVPGVAAGDFHGNAQLGTVGQRVAVGLCRRGRVGAVESKAILNVLCQESVVLLLCVEHIVERQGAVNGTLHLGQLCQGAIQQGYHALLNRGKLHAVAQLGVYLVALAALILMYSPGLVLGNAVLFHCFGQFAVFRLQTGFYVGYFSGGREYTSSLMNSRASYSIIPWRSISVCQSRSSSAFCCSVGISVPSLCISSHIFGRYPVQ